MESIFGKETVRLSTALNDLAQSDMRHTRSTLQR
jgi:hypothetical protein